MFNKIEQILNERYINRQRVIRGLLLGLIANENVLLIGPPGTAKSALIEDFASLIGGRYFSHLITKFSTPEELFGPVSFSGLKQDKFVHIGSGMLQEADIAFIDEIFKANSGILNSMLNIMNERVFKDAGHVTPVPLKMLVGASNELAESEALNALFDRFLIRFHVDYLDPASKKKLIMRGKNSAKLSAVVSQKDIEKAKEDIEKITVTDEVVDKYIEIINYLKTNMNIETSDRRDVKVWNILKANAYLDGNKEVTVDDFDILPDLIWRTPEERNEILRIIIKIASPTSAVINNLLDNAYELMQNANKIKSQKDIQELDRVKQLTGIMKQLKQIREKITGINSSKQFAIEAGQQIDNFIQQVGIILKDAMGLAGVGF